MCDNHNGIDGKRAAAPLLSFKTQCAAETESAGEKIAKLILTDADLPRYAALRGELGAGKTALTRGFARGFGYSGAVRSPTYALINEYRGADALILHFDMYRITSEDELNSIGYYDYLLRRGAVCIVEWSENIYDFLPERHIEVEITKRGESDDCDCCRIIEVNLVENIKPDYEVGI